MSNSEKNEEHQAENDDTLDLSEKLGDGQEESQQQRSDDAVLPHEVATYIEDGTENIPEVGEKTELLSDSSASSNAPDDAILPHEVATYIEDDTKKVPEVGEKTELLADSSSGDDEFGSVHVKFGDGKTIADNSLNEDSNITRTIDSRDFDVSGQKGPASGQQSEMGSNLNIRQRSLMGLTDASSQTSDYEVISVLGEGGMGTVYLARQSSLDRSVAIKIVKSVDNKNNEGSTQNTRLTHMEKTRRNQFLSEAVVTADLDHPNIVPIHDIALSADNSLFYSMKQVEGTPWNKVIKTKTLHENLDIFLNVCDAIAFAHSRGVVHRDIKPENVMLGDFGVVMLMDWGLAVTTSLFEKPGSIFQSTSMGGSPAYMAPEMTQGGVDQVGPASDIYLLGATLFEIITGYPPHTGKNVTQCLLNARENTIRPTKSQHQGELLAIASKAMTTNPEDRYQDVPQLQAGLRSYQSHTESIRLASRAQEDLEQAKNTKEYSDYSKSLFGFEEAIELWSGNTNAHEGLSEVRQKYAQVAHQNQDYDLGLSLLDESNPKHSPAIEELQMGQSVRNARQSRIVWLKRIAVALIAFIFLGGSAATYKIKQESDKTQIANAALGVANNNLVVERDKAQEAENQEKAAKELAVIAEKSAIKAKDEAVVAREKEKAAKVKAVTAEKLAIKAKDEALAAEKKEKAAKELAVVAEKLAKVEEKKAKLAEKHANYEAYVAKIGLAKARIDREEFDGARKLIDELKKISPDSKSINWELKYLENKAKQSRSIKTSSEANTIPPAGVDVAGSPSGIFVAIALEGGSLLVTPVDRKGELQKDKSKIFMLDKDTEFTAVAISPDEKMIAAACSDGIVRLWNLDSQKQTSLRGHTAAVSAVEFISNNQLLSGSLDKTARLWDISSATEIASCKHIGPVSDIAVTIVEQELVLVTSIADKDSGRAVIWRREISSHEKYFNRSGVFLEHEEPVLAIAMNSKGTQVASGDRSGKIFVWNPDLVKKVDYKSAINNALNSINAPDGQVNTVAQNRAIEETRELIDPDAGDQTRILVIDNMLKAHLDAIESVTFSADGKSLLSGSDDHTIKVWDVDSGDIRKTLRGHGGWVRSAEFSSTNDDLVLSTANDGTVRTWSVVSYADTTTHQTRSKKTNQLQPHNNDILYASFDHSGTRVITASKDRTARILPIDPVTRSFGKEILLTHNENTSSNQKGVLQEGSQYVSQSMAVDMAGQRIFIGGFDSKIRIWDINRGSEIASISGTGINTSIALSKDGSLLLTGSSKKGVYAKVWKINVDGQRTPTPTLLWELKMDQTATVTAFAISADGTLLFTGDQEGACNFWNAKTGKPVGSTFRPNGETRLNAAVFLPNGKELLLASDNNMVTRINVNNRKVINSLEHSGYVTGLSISNDGSQAITTSYSSIKASINSHLTLWDLGSNTKNELENLTFENNTTKDQSRVISAHFGPVPGTIVSTYLGNERARNYVKIWKIKTDKTAYIHKMLEFQNQLPFANIALLVHENQLLTLNGNAAFLWNTDSLGHVKSYRAHGTVTQASFFQNDKFVVTASRSIKIWDAKTGKSLFKKENPHQGSVMTVQCSPEKNSGLFASGGDDGVVRLWKWNPQANEITFIREFDCKTNDNDCVIHRVCFSHDGSQILTVGDDGSARIWNVNNNKPALVFKDKNSNTVFRCGAFSTDDKWILVGCDDKKARIWKVDNSQILNQQPNVIIEGHADRISDVKFLPGSASSNRIVTASRDKSVRIWDPRLESIGKEEAKIITPIIAREIMTLRKHSLGVTAVDITKSGDLLMTAGLDGKVILWPAKLPKSK